MSYGLHDWALARKVAARRSTFLCCSSAHAPDELPLVVALAPSVDARVDNGVAWLTLMQGLAQVALLTGRVVAWPDHPCNGAEWFKSPVHRRSLPLRPVGMKVSDKRSSS